MHVIQQQTGDETKYLIDVIVVADTQSGNEDITLSCSNVIDCIARGIGVYWTARTLVGLHVWSSVRAGSDEN